MGCGWRFRKRRFKIRAIVRDSTGLISLYREAGQEKAHYHFPNGQSQLLNSDFDLVPTK